MIGKYADKTIKEINRYIHTNAYGESQVVWNLEQIKKACGVAGIKLSQWTGIEAELRSYDR